MRNSELARPFVPSRAERAVSDTHAPLAPPLRAKPAAAPESPERGSGSAADELPWLTGSALPMEAPTPAGSHDSALVDELYGGAREVDFSESQQVELGTPAEFYGTLGDSSSAHTEEQSDDEDVFDNLVRETDLISPSEEEGLLDEPPEFPGTGADSRRVEEIATRLERIARSLRERGAAGPLTGHGKDPLGALITGYLLGVSESAERHDSTPED